MTPAEFLSTLDHAEARKPGPRGVVLELTAPRVLGEKGRHVGDTDRGPVYGYTRRQCRRMRERVYDAARDDLGT